MAGKSPHNCTESILNSIVATQIGVDGQEREKRVNNLV